MKYNDRFFTVLFVSLLMSGMITPASTQENVSLYEEMTNQQMITKTLIPRNLLENHSIPAKDVFWVVVQKIDPKQLVFQPFTGIQKKPMHLKNYPMNRIIPLEPDGEAIMPNGATFPIAGAHRKIPGGSVVGIVPGEKGVRYLLIPAVQKKEDILKKLHESVQ